MEKYKPSEMTWTTFRMIVHQLQKAPSIRCIQQLIEFSSLSTEDVRKLITTSASKHCELDPMPTWLLKECIEDLLPLITQIINLSLQLGDMPASLKKAMIINPLLKKLGLELIKKNYRPVSNLAFISKLIEKAVALQLIEHLKLNNL